MINRSNRSRRGSTAIEFAVWMSILPLLISAVMDYSWYMHQKQLVGRAARDGARVGAATDGSAYDSRVAAKSYAEDVLQNVGYAGNSVAATVYTNGPPGCSNLQFVRVTVNEVFTPIIGIVPSPPTIYSEFVHALEQQSSVACP